METSYYDIVDEHNKPLNIVKSYDEAHEKGLWYRAVHVIIHTPDGEVLMQKRSPSLAYHPDEIEISVGGGVDAGETPENAILREIKEEIGLIIHEDELHYIGVRKFNHKTKTQINRFFLYSYSVCLPKDKIHLRVDTKESSAVFFVRIKKLRKALLRHRIKNIGRISNLNGYWNYLLDSIT